MQVNGDVYKTLGQTLRLVVSSEGAGALYQVFAPAADCWASMNLSQDVDSSNVLQGFSTSLIGAVPYACIRLALYDTFKRAYRKASHTPSAQCMSMLTICSNAMLTGPEASQTSLTAVLQVYKRKKVPPEASVLCGAAAALVATAVTYPLEVVRRRAMGGQVRGIAQQDAARCRSMGPTSAASAFGEHAPPLHAPLCIITLHSTDDQPDSSPPLSSVCLRRGTPPLLWRFGAFMPQKGRAPSFAACHCP